MTCIICPHCSHTVEIPGPQRLPLTKRQAEVLAFIQQHNAEHNCSPTLEEICKRFDYRALATAHGLVTELRKRGWITRGFNTARSIRVIEDAA